MLVRIPIADSGQQLLFFLFMKNKENTRAAGNGDTHRGLHNFFNLLQARTCDES